MAPLAQARDLIGTGPTTARNYCERMSSASGWVPVIDLHEPDAAAAIGAACERVGFLPIVNHEVPAPIVEAAWATARSFFDMSLDDKLAVAMPYPGYPYGYSPLAGETLAKSLGNGGAPDLKESFAIGPVVRPTHTITDPDEAFAWSQNLWPAMLPAMEPAWSNYFLALSDLAARLLRLMANGLGLAEDHFAPMIERHTSAMRALNYPPRGTAGTVAEGQFGAGAHTDYGTLTILLADPDQGGLQVQGPGGEWHDVDAEPGSFVVNLGDAMARWTNDRWRSTMHRVQVPAGRRQSIAFFHNANWDAVIECLPTCLAAGEQPRYEPIEAGPHLMQKFQATVNRVRAGSVRFAFEDAPDDAIIVSADGSVDIPPQQRHHVEPADDAVFVVKFHR